MPWEETETHIRSGHQNPDKFDEDSFRTITVSAEEGISAIVACPKGQFKAGRCEVGTQIQSFLFLKEKGWTMQKAKKWFAEKQKEGVFLEGASPQVGGTKVHGLAIHPITTYHPEEWPEKRVYFAEELKQAASSLIGKPFFEDHAFPIVNSKITACFWSDEDDAIYYEGEVSEDTAQKIRDGYYKGVSVSVNPWRKGGGIEYVNGFAPYGFEFEEISLLHNLTPADPNAWIRLAEAMESEEYHIVQFAALNDFRPDTFRDTWIDLEKGIQMVNAIPKDGNTYAPVFLKFHKIKGWDENKIELWLKDNPQYNPAAQTTFEVTEIEQFVEEPFIIHEAGDWCEQKGGHWVTLGAGAKVCIGKGGAAVEPPPAVKKRIEYKREWVKKQRLRDKLAKEKASAYSAADKAKVEEILKTYRLEDLEYVDIKVMSRSEMRADLGGLDAVGYFDPMKRKIALAHHWELYAIDHEMGRAIFYKKFGTTHPQKYRKYIKESRYKSSLKFLGEHALSDEGEIMAAGFAAMKKTPSYIAAKMKKDKYIKEFFEGIMKDSGYKIKKER